ncbi:hypothetical protein I4U23_017770 [Adineta vaga]|nr:hypothetical protein I4U23_017770 [Adineta vaga]
MTFFPSLHFRTYCNRNRNGTKCKTRDGLIGLDEEGKTKTGLLCGLHFNPVVTTTFLYRDQDMDIELDKQISTEDLVQINQISKQMN